MKLRLRFEKTGDMRFIGHLDTQRLFQKLMRLAEIDIRYSEGFHPHQIMSFALPLSVGVESLGEYVDIEVNSALPGDRMLRSLNDVSPEGIRFTAAVLLPEQAKNAMSSITAADYLVLPKTAPPFDPEEEIRRLFHSAESFRIVKQTKKSEKELDLKAYVYVFSWREDGYFLRLSAGSETNIKPELLLSAFYEKAGERFEPSAYRIRRLELYGGDREKGLRPLNRFGSPL